MRATPAIAVHCAPLLDAATCDDVLARLARGAWEPGATHGTPDADGPRRRCAVSRDVPDEALTRVVEATLSLGRDAFGFALDGVHPDDPPLAMRYRPGDGFDWHLDCGVLEPPLGTRKLSFTVQLDDPAGYDGGDLELAAYRLGYPADVLAARRAAARARGVLVAFAAFQVHRVAPVTRGTRHALVGWLHGPPFR